MGGGNETTEIYLSPYSDVQYFQQLCKRRFKLPVKIFGNIVVIIGDIIAS